MGSVIIPGNSAKFHNFKDMGLETSGIECSNTVDSC